MFAKVKDERRGARNGDIMFDEAETDCTILRIDEPRGVYITRERQDPILERALFQPNID